MKGNGQMKIALLNENSQAGKNSLIFEVLKQVAEPMGHEVYNYGRFSEEDGLARSYVQVGLLGAVLLNSGAADFVISGCGTGMGAMLALNSFPGVFCGFAEQPLDGYLYSQVNAGNAIAMPFAKGFGWGSEVNLRYMFERLFAELPGGGFPREWAEAETKNRNILVQVKEKTCKDIITAVKEIDQQFVKDTFSADEFSRLFFKHCQDEKIADLVKSYLEQ